MIRDYFIEPSCFNKTACRTYLLKIEETMFYAKPIMYVLDRSCIFVCFYIVIGPEPRDECISV